MAIKRERFYLNTKEDRDIVRWLEAQSNKSAAIRQAIRETIQLQSVKEAVREVLKEELADVSTITPDESHEASPTITEDVDPEAGRRLDEMFSA